MDPVIKLSLRVSIIERAMCMKKKRNYNGRLFRIRRAYELKEINTILGVHIRTVQLWAKNGLKILNDGRRPTMVLGVELRRFLKAKRNEHEVDLAFGEFYCTTCKAAKKSIPGMVGVSTKTEKLLDLIGVCETCHNNLQLFSSVRIAAMWREKGLLAPLPSQLNPDKPAKSAQSQKPAKLHLPGNAKVYKNRKIRKSLIKLVQPTNGRQLDLLGLFTHDLTKAEATPLSGCERGSLNTDLEIGKNHE